VIAFLEWSTFEYWVFDPLLGLMISTMKALFNAESLGLTEAIFGVDKYFDQLFSEIGEYTTLLEEKGAWYDMCWVNLLKNAEALNRIMNSTIVLSSTGETVAENL
jgi:hypothetical protein